MLKVAAEQAQLIGQLRSFLAWVGSGRKLTSTGRIGLADARHLVELLATGDTIDPEIGGRVFKTKSSEDLAYLSRIVAWAKAARLVRVTGTKLMPVKKNAVLAERPLDLVLALLEAYPRLGQPLFPRNTWRASLVGDEFTDISQELVTALLRSAGPCPLDVLNGIACDVIEARYVLADLTEFQHDLLRHTITADVTIAMAALHALGIVVLDREASSAELTELGRYAVRRVRGMAQPGDPVLQGRVTLADVDDPPVWRRVVIPASYTLDRVHAVIQASMGWEESHLHMFRIKGREYGPAYLDAELETLDESQFRIGDLMKPGDRAGYEYDFGDGWEHELAVEASAVADADTVYPACTGGEGACPPEDCGGPGGFADLKDLLAGPPGPERDEMRTWAGEDYDPGHFDLTAASAAAASV
ncbi:MAG: plasmid pRiA4b ORF-3 family protein [Streptosporangiaceae bacterium]